METLITESRFLPEEQIDEISDIRRGRGGQTKWQRQIAWLRNAGIPFIVSAVGRPVVAVSSIEGRKGASDAKPTWTPKVLQKAA